MKKIVIIVSAVVLVAAIAVCGFVIAKKNGSSGSLPFNVTFSDSAIADEMLNDVIKNPTGWEKNATVFYGMDDAKKDEFIEQPENWLAFNLFLDLGNPNDKDILITGIEIENNGKNGIYLSNRLESTYIVVTKNSSSSMCMTALFDDNEPSVEEAEQMLKDMNVYIKYCEYPEDIDAEIPEENLLRAKVVF